MAKLADIVFDCAHPSALARFWAAVLDQYAVAPYDQGELDRLSSLGFDDPEHDPVVLVEPLVSGPRFWFQKVPEPKMTKNRVHIDLSSRNPDAEVARLVGLGATVLDEQPDDSVVVMRDPEGNEFCILR
jgi:hypothetical protein